MQNARQGAFHLFRVAKIDVYLHWTWFVVAAIEIEYLRNRYSSLVWCLLEYLALFLIVLLHEFGHALACRQVGGRADQIMLWPLGGVAYVSPPSRPAAVLWSIAAGPLVNVALLPPLIVGYFAARDMGWAQSRPDAYEFVFMVLFIDASLLAFNLLPVYPLDGGQILRSLLWFVLGRGRSLAAATILGFVGAAAFVVVALLRENIWLVAIAGYMLMNCWRGMKGALALMKLEKMPRRENFTCPACGTKPPIGAYWKCSNCGGVFDTFATQSTCG
ncbi:MAG TPA: site-2 protease family protein [Terracidiphilus sp.]|nr:site-2 protease family protein [Terracidiphilus sp.]